MDRFRVAILIPAFNEEKTIFKIVSKAKRFGQVLVVDDGSKDKTADVAKKSGAIVKKHKTNLGYDLALNTGFKKSNELNIDYIITIDADGQHNPKLLKKFIDKLVKGAMIVIGVRHKKDRIAEYVFSLYTNLTYGLKDPLCGLKAYNYKSLKQTGGFNSYESIGTEPMLKIVSSGKAFEQIYFKVRKRNGKTRFGSSIMTNFRILRSLFIWMFKKKSYDMSKNH